MVKFSKIILIILFFILFVLPELSAQSRTKGNLAGKVVSAVTNEPLVNVNLFFANTTLGATTGKDGNYIITNIPLGIYELIVSHISYELETAQVKLLSADSLKSSFRLKPRIIKVEDIEIISTIPKEWKKNLEKFSEMFIGKTKNSKKCKILNPEMINFTSDPETGEFTAFSDSMIHVENQSLGYRIHILLRSFNYDENKDFLKFVVYPKFQILKHKNDKELKNWIKKREETYIGSFKHFMRSLIENKLKEEKFSVSYVVRPGKFERIRILPSKENLLRPHDFGLNRLFFNGYLNIHHKKKGNSWIKIENYLVLVDQSGNFTPQNGISKWGTWAEERIADLLPLGYVLEK